MIFYYTLDEKLNPVPCRSWDEYHEWHDAMPEAGEWYTRKTGLGFTVSRDEVGDHEVSTVFLAMNHGIDEKNPVLWETMVFPECDLVGRYSSYAEAVEGHRHAIEEVKR